MGDAWISYGELARIIGAEAAGRLCAAYGGVSFYVPKNPSPESSLVKIIGHPALASLARVYGGETITVPNHRKSPSKARIIDMLGRGKSAREIALALDVTERYVQHLARNGGRRAARQFPLPGLS